VGRLAEQNITLRDGLFIPKGTLVRIPNYNMWDSRFYPQPDVFDGYRFYNLRQIPGQENASQFVSTSPTHLGFGYGVHACPGRFFAAAVIKIILANILIKYDLKLIPQESAPLVSEFGTALFADLHMKVAVRQRKEETSLE
jgi:cytochrome P450